MNRILAIFESLRHGRVERAGLRRDPFILFNAFAPGLIAESNQDCASVVETSTSASGSKVTTFPTMHWELTEGEHGRRRLRVNWGLGDAPAFSILN